MRIANSDFEKMVFSEIEGLKKIVKHLYHDNLWSALRGMEDRIRNLENLLERITDAESPMENRISDLENLLERIPDAESLCEDLEENMDSLRYDLESSIESVDDRCDYSSDSIATLQNDIHELDRRVSQIEGRI